MSSVFSLGALSSTSKTSHRTTSSRDPFASSRNIKLDNYDNSVKLHSGNKLHISGYSLDEKSPIFHRDEQEIAFLRDDIANRYLNNCFDLTIVPEEHFKNLMVLRGKIQENKERHDSGISSNSNPFSDDNNSKDDPFKEEELATTHTKQHLEDYKKTFFDMAYHQRKYYPDMVLKINAKIKELSDIELECAGHQLAENLRFLRKYEDKFSNELTALENMSVIKLYCVHSKMMMTLPYFDKLIQQRIEHEKGSDQDRDPCFPAIALNWSQKSIICILRFIYTREVSADITDSNSLNELSMIASSGLESEDFDFAVTFLKRKSMVYKQYKLDPFKRKTRKNSEIFSFSGNNKNENGKFKKPFHFGAANKKNKDFKSASTPRNRKSGDPFFKNKSKINQNYQKKNNLSNQNPFDDEYEEKKKPKNGGDAELFARFREDTTRLSAYDETESDPFD